MFTSSFAIIIVIPFVICTQPQVNLEYGLTPNFQERLSIYTDLEDKNVFVSIKDSIVTLKDLLSLTLTWKYWALLFLALATFVLAGGFFTYNFAVLKQLVEVRNNNNYH